MSEPNCPDITSDVVPLPNRVTPDMIDAEIENARQIDFHQFPGTPVTVVCVELDNGFRVVGKAAAVSAKNFDDEVGRRVALDDVRNQLWQLLGWRLKEGMFDVTT